MDSFFWASLLFLSLFIITRSFYRTTDISFTELNLMKEEQLRLSAELALHRDRIRAEEVRADWFRAACEKTKGELEEVKRLVVRMAAELRAAQSIIEQLRCGLKASVVAEIVGPDIIEKYPVEVAQRTV